MTAIIGRLSHIAALAALAAPLHAQDAVDRRFVATVLGTLAKATNAAQLPPMLDCGTPVLAIVRLCEGLIATRRAEFTTNKTDATTARDLLESVVAEQPKWPTAWYGLGVARIQAARAGVSRREGPLQPDSVPNSTGAESALIRALELDSTFTLAAEALALASIRTDSISRLNNRVSILRWVRRLLPPAGLYGEALVEREAHHPDTAVAVWRLLLQRGGVDRGLVELELARDLYASGHPDEGRRHLLAGAADSTALSRHAYRQELDWVASWDELAQWDSTPAPARPAWLRDFWALRDVREGQPDGARLVEHYVRLENVFEMFRYTYPSTGRLLAAQVRSKPCSSFACPEHDTVTTVIDYHTAEVASALGAKRPYREFQSTEDRIDDRGLIYIRQGMPLSAMRTIDNGGFELWKYERPGTPLFLAFSPHQLPNRLRYIAPYDIREVLVFGDIAGEPPAPAMLIPTVAQPGSTQYGYFQAGFCGLKHSLCQAFPDPVLMPDPQINCAVAGSEFRFDPSVMTTHFPIGAAPIGTPPPPRDSRYIWAREREEGWWADSIATNFDADPLPFIRLLSPAIEMHALDRTDAVSSRLVIAFAVPGTQLATETTHAGAAPSGHPIRLQVIAYRASDGRRVDFDTTATFGPSHALGRGEYLTGVVELPVPPGSYTTSIVFTQDDSSGAVVHRDNVVVSGDEGVLRVSDLVFSRAGSDVHWNSGATTVASCCFPIIRSIGGRTTASST